jgi:hypothetical protein
MATKHPTLVQVWIGWRSAVPLGEIESEWKLHDHRRALAVGRGLDGQRDQQLAGLAMEHLLDRAALQRLAVAGALHAPCRRRRGGLRLLRGRALRRRRRQAGDCEHGDRKYPMALASGMAARRHRRSPQ